MFAKLRRNEMATLAKTPTLPDDERLAELAKLFIDRLGALRSKLGEKHQGAISWHPLFS